MRQPQPKLGRRTMLTATAALTAMTLIRPWTPASATSVGQWRFITTHAPENARIAFASARSLTLAVPAIATYPADISRSDALFVLTHAKTAASSPLPAEIYAAHRDGVLTAEICASPAHAATVTSDIARFYGSDEAVFKCADLEDLRQIVNAPLHYTIPTLMAACATSRGENAARDALLHASQHLVTVQGVALKQVKRIVIIMAGARGRLRLGDISAPQRFPMNRVSDKPQMLYGAVYDDALADRIRATVLLDVEGSV